MSITFEEAVRVTGARVVEEQRRPRELRVTTDTRTLRSGDTFLALHGGRFDGHDFAAQAVAKGASALVLDRAEAVPEGVAVLLVPDTRTAYMALAGAARRHFSADVIAITGSTGKTTVKVLLKQLFTAAGTRAIASPANENNEIGVSKLLLAASEDRYDVVVVEIGARYPDDVAKLAAVALPDVGVLTNIGEAHLEIMGSREQLEEAKWSLFSTGARSVLNLDDEASRRRAPSLERAPAWFLAAQTLPVPLPAGRLCAVLGTQTLLVADGMNRKAEHAIDVRLPGAYNRSNLAAAIAAAIEVGSFDDAERREKILAAIGDLVLPKGRYERIPLAHGLRLIYDAYNANPSGTIAALEAFAQEGASRRIAVLSSMAELGVESEALHERVGERAAATADWLLVGGEYAQALARGARRGGLAPERIVVFGSNAEAADWLREHARHDDLVLLKGSRKYQLEEIVERLRAAS